MLVGHLEHPTTHLPLTNDWPALLVALAWAQRESPEKDPGRYEIQREMYAVVQDTPTQPRENLTFESHRNYVDLHCCVGGGELMEWAPENLLHPLEAYDPDKDVQIFAAPTNPVTSILMNSGTFAIFLPHEAHMTKVRNGTHTRVVKVVVKIHTAALQRTT